MFVLCSSLLCVTACSTGDDGDGGTTVDATPDRDAHIKCTAPLTMSGTFTPTGTLDPAGGCQPAGTWAVQVVASSMGNCTTVAVKPSYSYTVTKTATGQIDMITYNGSGDETHLGISASGGGECEAGFEHVNGSGTAFNEIDLHPRIPEPTAGATTLTITGTGEYNQWDEHP